MHLPARRLSGSGRTDCRNESGERLRPAGRRVGSDIPRSHVSTCSPETGASSRRRVQASAMISSRSSSRRSSRSAAASRTACVNRRIWLIRDRSRRVRCWWLCVWSGCDDGREATIREVQQRRLQIRSLEPGDVSAAPLAAHIVRVQSDPDEQDPPTANRLCSRSVSDLTTSSRSRPNHVLVHSVETSNFDRRDTAITVRTPRCPPPLSRARRRGSGRRRPDACTGVPGRSTAPPR